MPNVEPLFAFVLRVWPSRSVEDKADKELVAVSVIELSRSLRRIAHACKQDFGVMTLDDAVAEAKRGLEFA